MSVGWAGYFARTKEKRNVYRVLVENVKERTTSKTLTQMKG
jgi:hypothetical protein